MVVKSARRPGVFRSPSLLVAAGCLVAAALYLAFWPVPVSPVAWEAPPDPGYVDPFAPNDRLAPVRLLGLGAHFGPEDVAGGPDGYLYVSTGDGAVLRLRGDGNELSVFAETGGRPLGLDFDGDGRLYVANAELGLQRIDRDGAVQTLVDTVDGRPLVYVNDVAAGSDGQVWFTESSSKFGAARFGGAYPASLLDILEHGGHGRVFAWDSRTRSVDVLLEGLDFANGIAVSADQRYLLIAETGHYRIWRYWLTGPGAGTKEIVLDNLPGFPDNINAGLAGRFWIGLVAPRNRLLDRLSAWPALRQAVARLPAALRPSAARSSHVVGITGDGVVLMDLQDTSARVPALTGVHETREALYLSRLVGPYLPYLDKRDLATVH